MLNISKNAILLACLGSIILGFSPLFVRLSDMGPMTTAFYRMLFATPFLYIWFLHDRQQAPTQLSGSDFFIMTSAGILFALDLAFWNGSLDHTLIVNSTLFNNTAVFFVPLVAWIIFNEKPTRRLLSCVTIAMLGAFLLFQESLNIGFDSVFGDLLALVSGLMVALYVMTIKKIRHHIPTGTLMFGTAIPSLFALGIIAWMCGENFWPLTHMDIISALGQALLIHVFGQSLLAYAMGYIPSQHGAIALLLCPVTAAITGVIFYNETMSYMNLLGMGLILISIVLVKEKAKTTQAS